MKAIVILRDGAQVPGIICGLPLGYRISIPDAHADALIAKGDAKEYTEPEVATAPEIEQREPVVETREPKPRKKKFTLP